MGKNGFALRESKKSNYSRMYTAAEIEAIKKQAVDQDRAAMEKLREHQREWDRIQINELLEQEWKEREAALRGADDQESFQKVLALMIHIPVAVLCEKFHWKPIQDESDGRNRTKAFVDAVVAEIDRICTDETQDIRRYAQECYEKYGVKFELD